MEHISLYNESDIHLYAWPKTFEGERSRQFLEPLIKKGINHFIDNIHVKMSLLVLGDRILPITINDERENSIVCSPYSYYVSYPLVLGKRIDSRVLRVCSEFFLKIYGKFMNYGKLYKVIIVNNWLFTTNPYIKLDSKTIKEITRFLKERFPDYAIVFRSILREICGESYDSLLSNGYKLIPCKCVYITDTSNEEISKTRILKSDTKFLKESVFKTSESEEKGETDIKALQRLYNALYIEKYSSLNPAYNTNFFDLVLKSKALNIITVTYEGVPEGIAGYIFRDGWMISPLFGYDPLKPDKKGIYRFLSAYLLQKAFKNKLIFNQSAGGSFFKKIRRAKLHVEYIAVDSRHLASSRRLVWNVLSFLLNSIGLHVMKKY